MKSNTRKTSLTALFMAISVVLLYIGGLLPTFSASMAALASMLTVAAVVESGITYGALCFVGAGILSALIVPEKSGVVLYCVFLGYYPIIKSLIERLGKMLFEWLIKLVFVNIVITVYLVFLQKIFFADMGETLFNILPLGYLLINVVFVMYDYAMTAVAKFYVNKISKHRNGR